MEMHLTCDIYEHGALLSDNHRQWFRALVITLTQLGKNRSPRKVGKGGQGEKLGAPAGSDPQKSSAPSSTNVSLRTDRQQAVELRNSLSILLYAITPPAAAPASVV